MKRKIVQVALGEEKEVVFGVRVPIIIALADDGTAWTRAGTANEYGWKELPPLPDIDMSAEG
jgi:hypothetical protein